MKLFRGKGIKKSSKMSQNFEQERERMVQTQIEARGVKDKKVLKAMREAPGIFLFQRI